MLPETLREPLVAHYFEGHTQTDIAAALGIPRQTVTNRIRRGVEELRQRLRHQGIATGTVALSSLLTANAAPASTLPPSLLTNLGKLALSGAGRFPRAVKLTRHFPVGGATTVAAILTVLLFSGALLLTTSAVHSRQQSVQTPAPSQQTEMLRTAKQSVQAPSLSQQTEMLHTAERAEVEAQYALLADVSQLALGAVAIPETEIIVGHIESYDGRRKAAELFREIEQMLPGITIRHDDTLKGKPAEPDRLLHEERLADLIHVYAGPTSMLNEVAGLARAGRIQPVDVIAGVRERLNLDDLYPNILEPVTFDGHLWAIPIRVVVPVMLDVSESRLDSHTWETLIQSAEAGSFGSGGEQYGDKEAMVEEFYLIWRTLMQQSGVNIVTDGRYDLSDPRCLNAFDDVYRLYVRKVPNPEIWIGSSDILTDFPQTLDSLVHDLPFLQNGDAYCAAWTWYVAIRADVSGHKLEAILQFLEVMLSSQVQLKLLETSYAVPVRPSLVQHVAGDAPQYSTLFSMAERLRFRAPGKFSEKAEYILRQAFAQALETPDAYPELIADASEAIAALPK